MLAFVVVLLVAAEQGAAPPVRLGTPGLTYVDFPEAKGELFADRLLKRLELAGIRVTGKQEIAALLGLERQKQLLGCSEDSSSCLAELAGALGVDGILTGTLGRTGEGFVVNLKIVSGSGEARTLAVVSGRARDETELLDALDQSAAELARQLYAALGRKPAEGAIVPAPPVASSRSATDLWPLPVAVGAAATVIGVALWAAAFFVHQDLKSASSMFGTNDGLLGRADLGRTLEKAGWITAGCGVALIAAGAAMGIAGRLARTEVRVTGLAGPGFGFVTFGGAWP